MATTKQLIIDELKESSDAEFTRKLRGLNTFAVILSLKEEDGMTDAEVESMFRAAVAEAESRKDLALPAGGYFDLAGLANLSRQSP